MRICVIGAGSIGRRHIGNLLSMGHSVSVIDPDERQIAHVIAQYPEAIPVERQGKHADAWVIASPYQTHVTYAREAIYRSIPFLVEKPLGAVDQLPLWLELNALAGDLVTAVGYQLRFHPILRMMREQFRAPTSGGFYCDVNMSTWPGQSYGPWLLECSHELDAALFCGAPTDVAQVDRINATSANIWLGEEERWLVSLDADADRYYRSWRLAQGQSTIDVQFHAADALGTLMYYDEMLHFIECVREGRQTDCPLTDGVKVLEVCAQIEQMARKAA